jgi:hypothetical protein
VPTKALNQAAKRNIELLGQEYENRVPVRPSKPFTPAYPKGAQAKGVQGEVDCIPEHRAKLVLFL